MRSIKSFFKAICLAALIWAFLICFRWVFFNLIHSDDILEGMAGLRAAVTESMENGVEQNIFYVKNIEIDDISSINQYVDSAYGSVSGFTVLLASGEYLAIKLSYTASENIYVIRKFLYDEDIPETEARAQEIYETCENFYSTYITSTMTDFEKEVTLHDYLVANCKYGYPSNEDDAYTVYGALVLGTAVCDGYAQSFYLLATCMGIPCDIVIGTASGELHAWNQVKINGEWYNVDVTWDDALPDTGSYVKHTYMNITDSALESSHSWTHSYYQECNSTTYNYYVKNIAAFENYEEFVDGFIKLYSTNGVMECMIKNYNSTTISVSFLKSQLTGYRRFSYIAEDLGEYTVVVVYLK